MLNRCGCRTISVDVSPTALALGRAVFERDPRTNWSLDPQFLTYDGRRLPVDNASCDSVVLNDAFHHVPNQRELLQEMARVLRPDGIVVMSEPGRGHGTAEHSVQESSTGVLENELVLQDLAALAGACGFAAVNVIVAAPQAHQEIPASRLPTFMGGRGFPSYWKAFCSALEQHHYIVCYKSSPRLTTRRPGRLAARVDIPRSMSRVNGRVGEPIPLVIHLTNTGDTLWLSDEAAGVGWTRLGGHLLTATDPRRVVDYDWLRCSLTADVPPGAKVTVETQSPPITVPGSYIAVFDLVVEGLVWFADRGSQVATIELFIE
jgi:hypothetical protein